jgi:hypothetical protein
MQDIREAHCPTDAIAVLVAGPAATVRLLLSTDINDMYESHHLPYSSRCPNLPGTMCGGLLFLSSAGLPHTHTVSFSCARVL